MEEAQTKIVVIDDDPAVLTVLETRLGVNYQLVCTDDPRNAVALIRRERPDAVLCDIDMPEVSGGDISAALLKDPSTAHIPFVFLTNLATAQELDDLGEEVSGRPCVSKGAPLAKLLATIERVCGHGEAARGEAAF